MSDLDKRSISLSGHRTSIALEKEFWIVLEAMAAHASVPLSRFIAQLDTQRPPTQGLASTLRVAVLRYAASSDTRIVLPETSVDTLATGANVTITGRDHGRLG